MQNVVRNKRSDESHRVHTEIYRGEAMKQFNPNQVTEELYNWLETKGVTNFIFVIHDPNFDVDGSGHKGSAAWEIGACELLKNELIHAKIGEPKEGGYNG
jgi:hypothetical protein